MLKKHCSLVPSHLLKNKSVLDLGSSIAATGAWTLSNGASFYKGIEIQEEFVSNSKKALYKYYSKDKWNIENTDVESFLNTNKQTFDIVIANGILHSFDNPTKIIHQISKICNIAIFESSHPISLKKTKYLNSELKKQLLNSKDYENYIENEPFIEMGLEGMTMHLEKTLLFNGLRPSFGAIKQIMIQQGFDFHNDSNKNLKMILPEIYSPYKRFGAIFIKEKNAKYEKFGFESAMRNRSPNKIYNW